MLLSIFLAALNSLIFIGAFLILAHFKKLKRTIVVFWVLWFSALPVYVLLFFSISEVEAVPFVNGIFLYLVASYFLGQFYFQIERGLSMRIMVEICNSSLKKLTGDQMEKAYTYDFILQRRLSPAVKTGYLCTDGSHYWLTLKGHRSSKVFRFFKEYLHLDALS